MSGAFYIDPFVKIGSSFSRRERKEWQLEEWKSLAAKGRRRGRVAKQNGTEDGRRGEKGGKEKNDLSSRGESSGISALGPIMRE